MLHELALSRAQVNELRAAPDERHAPPLEFEPDSQLVRDIREQYPEQLEEAPKNVRQLSGRLPICSNFKKIRDDHGYWQQVESYISEYSQAQFSHGICPDCTRKLYPEFHREK